MRQGPRGAVLVSLELTQDGLKISLDDAVQAAAVGEWKQPDHFTHKDVV